MANRSNMNVPSDTKPRKVVHNERISLITVNEDPILKEIRRRGWYVATGTTVHVCNSRDMFVDYHPWTNHEVILDGGHHVEVEGIGTVVLQLTTGKILTLSNVFHMPTIVKCIVSVSKLMEQGFQPTIGHYGCILKKDGEIVGRGYLDAGLCRLGVVAEHMGGS